MILPVGASSFKEAMKMGVEVYHNLKVVLDIIATTTTITENLGNLLLLLPPSTTTPPPL